MKNFLKWAEENSLELPVINDAGEGEKATSEERVRTGANKLYPKGYVSSQYPPLYKANKSSPVVRDEKD